MDADDLAKDLIIRVGEFPFFSVSQGHSQKYKE